MNRNITISGTDPTNPRCAAHIDERLTQIKRDVEAMYEEAGRLMVFSESIRDVLREHQHVPDGRAVERSRQARGRISELRELLADVAGKASQARAALHDSGVNMRAPFTWTPSR